MIVKTVMMSTISKTNCKMNAEFVESDIFPFLNFFSYKNNDLKNAGTLNFVFFLTI